MAERMPGVAAVLVRPAQAPEAAAIVGSAAVCTSLDAFIARGPAVAIECASASMLAETGS